MNDDLELGQSFLLDDDDDDDDEKEEEVVVSSPKKKKRKKSKRRSIKDEKNPREWRREDWQSWFVNILPEGRELPVCDSGPLLDVVGAAVESRGLNVVVVCSSAARCADVARLLRPTGTVSKLFGKHMKLQEQIDQMKQPDQIAVGTAQRLEVINDKVGLPFRHHRGLVVVDANPDAKSFTPVTLPDAKHALARFLQSCTAAHSDLTVTAAW